MRQSDRVIAAMMHRHGYQLVRKNRHAVWRHARTGSQIVTPVSGSDWRGLKNLLSYLKRKESR